MKNGSCRDSGQPWQRGWLPRWCRFEGGGAARLAMADPAAAEWCYYCGKGRGRRDNKRRTRLVNAAENVGDRDGERESERERHVRAIACEWRGP